VRAVLLVAALLVLSCSPDYHGPMDEYCLVECRETLEEEVVDAFWLGNDRWWTRCACLTHDSGTMMIHADLKLSDRPENRRSKSDK